MEFERRAITVFEARRDDNVLGIDLDRGRLCQTFRIRPNCRKLRVVEYVKLVGIVEG